jgi:hypothetical protein
VWGQNKNPSFGDRRRGEMLLALDAYLIRTVMRSKSPSSGEENIIIMLRILRLTIAPIMRGYREIRKGVTK